MAVHKKIRLMRELRNWSQEDMAEKMNLSPSGYAKIERGETKLHLEKLDKIAKIYNLELLDLLREDGGMGFLNNKNNQLGSMCHGGG